MLLAVFDVLAAPLECMDVVKLEQTVAAVEPLVNHSDVGVHTAATSLADYLSQQLSGRMVSSSYDSSIEPQSKGVVHRKLRSVLPKSTRSNQQSPAKWTRTHRRLKQYSQRLQLLYTDLPRLMRQR